MKSFSSAALTSSLWLLLASSHSAIARPYCKEEVKVQKMDGELPIDVDQAVRIISQDTSTVTVDLVNSWSTPNTTVDSIFYQYKENHFSQKCYEEQNVDGMEVYVDALKIQCMAMVPVAYIDICVADNGGVTCGGDEATVPSCCMPDLPENTPTVCYKLSVNCDPHCPTSTSRRRALRGGE